MSKQEGKIAANNPLEADVEVLPGETLAQTWTRSFKMKQAKSCTEPLEAQPRNLALLGRALWILLHGEEEPTPIQWSPRPPAARCGNFLSAKSSATILLAGLARSLAEDDDSVVKQWLGSWSHSPVKLVSASPEEWGRLLEEVTQTKSPARPMAPNEIIP